MSWRDEDDKEIRGPKDRSKISIDEPWEVTYWSNELNVPAEELKKAVRNAGTSIESVKDFLNKK